MVKKEFYLSSHDLISDPSPRKCEVVHEVKGLCPNSHYLLVKIAPSLKTEFRDGPIMDFEQIILSILGNCTTQDIGTKPVFADIVICPTYSGGILDEETCSKIGVGSLHSTYAEALKNSPVGDE